MGVHIGSKGLEIIKRKPNMVSCPVCKEPIRGEIVNYQIAGETPEFHYYLHKLQATAFETREREARIDGAKAFVTHLAGKRCKNKDTDDFPELTEKDSRCYCCEMWEHFDEWLQKEQA